MKRDPEADASLARAADAIERAIAFGAWPWEVAQMCRTAVDCGIERLAGDMKDEARREFSKRPGSW